MGKLRINKGRWQEAIAFYLFLLPWIIGFTSMTLGPMIVSIWYSLTDYNMLMPPWFVGLENYQRLFTEDPLFWKSLYNTVYYVIFSVPLGLVAGLILALLLNQKLRGMNLFRTIYYLPSIVPMIAGSFLWVWIFNPRYGLLNRLLGMIGLPDNILWLHSEVWSKPALIIMSLWGVGGGMIIFLAGLQGIPVQLYEAAQLDGASKWSQFWKVTLPLLTPTIFFNLIMGLIGAFQTFAQVYVMTGGQGGPLNSTLFYMLYLYRQAFEFFNMGYASAMAWVLFVIVIALTLLQLKLSKRWVFYQGDARG
ncbi:MAG: sugar ABC transporter permease [Firmicutes bacterium]|nr:sugar ABC transporter permease [Bacillota bacterium]